MMMAILMMDWGLVVNVQVSCQTSQKSEKGVADGFQENDGVIGAFLMPRFYPTFSLMKMIMMIWMRVVITIQ